MRLEWNDEEVLRDIGKITAKVTKEGAKKVMRDARRYCPKEKTGKTDKWGNRPGSLRASIRIQKSKFKGGGYLVIAGGKGFWGDAFYAPFVELGTPGTVYRSGQKRFETIKKFDVMGRRRTKKEYVSKRVAVQAHPFMRKALARNKRRILQKFREAMK